MLSDLQTLLESQSDPSSVTPEKAAETLVLLDRVLATLERSRGAGGAAARGPTSFANRARRPSAENAGVQRRRPSADLRDADVEMLANALSTTLPASTAPPAGKGGGAPNDSPDPSFKQRRSSTTDPAAAPASADDEALELRRLASGYPPPKAVVAGHAQSSELFEAVGEGDLGALAQLLAAGVPASCVDDDGNTALMAAAEGESECAAMLLENGCPVNHKNSEGKTALHQACSYEDADCVRLLLGAGASADMKDNDGASPVSIAKELADGEILEALTGKPPEPKAAVESAADVQLAAGGRARRNSVSADEIESFTSAHSDANK